MLLISSVEEEDQVFQMGGKPWEVPLEGQNKSLPLYPLDLHSSRPRVPFTAPHTGPSLRLTRVSGSFLGQTGWGSEQLDLV